MTKFLTTVVSHKREGQYLLQRDALPQLWRDYPLSFHGALEDLLVKFEVWSPVPNTGSFLVPCLFPKEDHTIGVWYTEQRGMCVHLSEQSACACACTCAYALLLNLTRVFPRGAGSLLYVAVQPARLPPSSADACAAHCDRQKVRDSSFTCREQTYKKGKGMALASKVKGEAFFCTHKVMAVHLLVADPYQVVVFFILMDVCVRACRFWIDGAVLAAVYDSANEALLQLRDQPTAKNPYECLLQIYVKVSCAYTHIQSQIDIHNLHTHMHARANLYARKHHAQA